MKRNRSKSGLRKNDPSLFCEIWEAKQELSFFSIPARGVVEFMDALEQHQLLKTKIEEYANSRSKKR